MELDLLVYGTADKRVIMIHDKGNFEVLSQDLSPHTPSSILID